MEKFINICNRVIEYSFYGLFFLVPLYFSGDTFELFEFNKMWLVFALTVIIMSSWIIKMIIAKEIRIQRTPLDLPTLLFLLFQGIATVHSLDPHVSLWGYYSRFNGGFLSTLSYILLYYAFVSNILPNPPKPPDTKHAKPINVLFFTSAFGIMLIGFLFSLVFNAGDAVSEFFKFAIAFIGVLAGFFLLIKTFPTENKILQTIYMSILGGTIVALWGLPSHFGYDPTCLQFRGTFDVSCWTDAFQPKVRIFSMLGQPNWLAAYLAILLPIVIAFFVNVPIQLKKTITQDKKTLLLAIGYVLLTILFFADIIFTQSQSGFIGAIGAIFVFVIISSLIKLRNDNKTEKKLYIRLVAFVFLILLLTFFFAGSPIEKLRVFTFQNIIAKMQSTKQTTPPKQSQPTGPALEYSITSSSRIRSIVWKGAVDIWKDNPLIGTGVETFAYAYYKYRPRDHNLTSEWDYLYNKAHNEYLNYLATTGALGLGTYLLMIGWFIFLCIKRISNVKHEKNEIGNLILIAGLLAGYAAILITNFFGFSVVMLNLFLFLIPAFVFGLNKSIGQNNAFTFPAHTATKTATKNEPLGTYSMLGITVVGIIALLLLFLLFQFREADKAYALGNNFDKVNQYEAATPYLRKAVDLRPGEPVFQDELAINLAALSVIEAYQKNATQAAKSAQEAIAISNNIVTNYPNNVVFWKTRVRLFYTLGQLNPEYNKLALQAIEKAHALAPTDAKILYNLGVLQGQTGDPKKAIQTLEKTVAYKPDYRDAYFALALFYRDLAIDKTGKVINPEMEQKAVETLTFILEKLSPNDKQIQDLLKDWGEK